jgi:hypothetical protein
MIKKKKKKKNIYNNFIVYEDWYRDIFGIFTNSLSSFDRKILNFNGRIHPKGIYEGSNIQGIRTMKQPQIQ